MMTLGERIRQLRQEKGFSQEELAAYLNVSRQAVSKWEKSLSYPDTENLLALAALFEVSADELAGLRRQEASVQEPKTEPETETQPQPEAMPAPEKKRGPWWFVVIGAVLLVIFLLNLLQLAGGDAGGELPGDGTGTPVQSTQEQPDGPRATEPGGTEPVPPAPRPMVEDTGEFALLWETAPGWEYISAGAQETFFPFGTSLTPTELQKVEGTDSSAVELHTVTCGALSLRYRNIRNEGAPAVEVVDSITTITSGYETPRGIGVSSDEAELLRCYRDELVYGFQVSGPDILCKHEHQYIYAPEAAFGSAVIFYISGGHVAGIEVRAGDDSGYEAWRPDHVSRFPVKDGKPDFSQRQEPEKEDIDETRAVYIALYALQNDVNLSAEDEYRHRRTIYDNLQYLDWQAYGKLGELGQEDRTRRELLHWLQRRETLSADELVGLLAGASRSNLDGWMTETYAVVVARACAAYPVGYVRALASAEFSDAEREGLLAMTVYACAGDGALLREVVSAVEGDPLRYTDAERIWTETLLERLRELSAG